MHMHYAPRPRSRTGRSRADANIRTGSHACTLRHERRWCQVTAEESEPQGTARSAHSPATRDTRGIVPSAEREALAAGLGAELRKLRAKAGLTQARVAALSGMDVSTVKRFERGVLRPTIHALGALARTLAPEGAERLVMGKLLTLAGDSARAGRNAGGTSKKTTPPATR
ncbi:hypothetical protein AHiyo4_38250 [Arthrobacter sp. Hiyo4]|nr:hypothetical protein AHiyo4_38250 [Arthrobacter sp. Hiyo4]